jgi:DNA-binding NarL/FixJ family response regulator
MIGVVLADDQALVRSGFRVILDAAGDIDVVGEAANGREAIQLVLEQDPDVVLMDIRMPELDGIAATRELMRAESRARVVMLTTFDADELVVDALRAGASGYLLKDAQPAELLQAVRVVAGGGALLAPAVTRQVLDRFVASVPADDPPPPDLEELTPRELEVLKLVAAAHTNAEIAGRLTVTEATVKAHVSAILRKLSLRDRVQAVVLAYDVGLVRPASGFRRRRSEE